MKVFHLLFGFHLRYFVFRGGISFSKKVFRFQKRYFVFKEGISFSEKVFRFQRRYFVFRKGISFSKKVFRFQKRYFIFRGGISFSEKVFRFASLGAFSAHSAQQASSARAPNKFTSSLHEDSTQSIPLSLHESVLPSKYVFSL
jgi:hypothetical protein